MYKTLIALALIGVTTLSTTVSAVAKPTEFFKPRVTNYWVTDGIKFKNKHGRVTRGICRTMQPLMMNGKETNDVLLVGKVIGTPTDTTFMMVDSQDVRDIAGQSVSATIGYVVHGETYYAYVKFLRTRAGEYYVQLTDNFIENDFTRATHMTVRFASSRGWVEYYLDMKGSNVAAINVSACEKAFNKTTS